MSDKKWNRSWKGLLSGQPEAKMSVEDLQKNYRHLKKFKSKHPKGFYTKWGPKKQR